MKKVCTIITFVVLGLLFALAATEQRMTSEGLPASQELSFTTNKVAGADKSIQANKETGDDPRITLYSAVCPHCINWNGWWVFKGNPTESRSCYVCGKTVAAKPTTNAPALKAVPKYKCPVRAFFGLPNSDGSY